MKAEADAQGVQTRLGRKPYRLLVGLKEKDGTVIKLTGKQLMDFVKTKRREVWNTNRESYEFEYLYKDLKPQKVIDLYKAGRSITGIAKEFGCSRAPIYEIIEESKHTPPVPSSQQPKQEVKESEPIPPPVSEKNSKEILTDNTPQATGL